MAKNYLVMGATGAGKSTLARELQARGYCAFDADYDAGIAFWQNKQTGLEEEFPENPPNDWGMKHFWRWKIDTLQNVLTENADRETVFVCGTSGNRHEAYPLFDEIFVLTAAKDIIRERILHRRDNDFGKQPEELRWALAEHDRVLEEAAKQNFIIIDTSHLTPDRVVGKIEHEIKDNK